MKDLSVFASGFVTALLVVIVFSSVFDPQPPRADHAVSAIATIVVEENGKILPERPIVYCIRRNIKGKCFVTSVTVPEQPRTIGE